MWLTLSEVARYLRVSKETIYKLAQASKIPASKLGNQWRFKQELVDQWMQTQTPATETETRKIEIEKNMEVHRG
jgi:excisionase family DNA binding protein